METVARNLQSLGHLRQPRCLKPPDFRDVVTAELHHFSDASSSGYGAVSYLRQINCDGRIHSSFVISKSRVTPMRELTIPRLELCAAVLAAKLDCMLRRELDIKLSRSVFWSDSMVVLHYIQNEDKRFHVFVANRIATIRSLSLPSQWRHVSSELNPADDASRGLTAEDMIHSTRWFSGPSFLWEAESECPSNPIFRPESVENDPEVRREPVIYASVAADADRWVNDIFDRIFNRRSDWIKLKPDVAWILRAKRFLLAKSKNLPTPDMKDDISVSEIHQAEADIVKCVQHEAFSDDIHFLIANQAESDKRCLKKQQSKIYRLEPEFTGGLLRVGGRLRSHPVILPRRHPVVGLVIRHYHLCSGQSGREHVLSLVRQHYWIISARSSVRKVLSECMACRRMKTKPLCQKMSDLPRERISPGDPPFTYTGVDIFGPFAVKRGRTVLKRYGCLFTCFTVRAIHIEVVHTLETDSFLQALERFMCRRGEVKVIWSDNGTNFIGAANELRDSPQSLNQNKVNNFLRRRSIEWCFNTPTASHIGWCLGETNPLCAQSVECRYEVADS